jgi:type VI secretion system protein ImpF
MTLGSSRTRRVRVSPIPTRRISDLSPICGLNIPMAKTRPDQRLVSSVLDRLLDNEPDVSREPARNRHQLLRELKESVRRDLKDLLNTRVRCLTVPPELAELKLSLVNYGIPDFTGVGMTSENDRRAFARLLQNIIRQYEPRFKTVKVQLVDNPEPLDRTLRFRIDALLHAEPAPEPVTFDSTLKPITGDFEVEGGRG